MVPYLSRMSFIPFDKQHFRSPIQLWFQCPYALAQGLSALAYFSYRNRSFRNSINCPRSETTKPFEPSSTYNASSSALSDISALTLVGEGLVPSRRSLKHNAIQTQKSRETRALSTWIASAATDIYAYTDLRRIPSGTLRAFNRRRATSTYADE